MNANPFWDILRRLEDPLRRSTVEELALFNLNNPLSDFRLDLSNPNAFLLTGAE
jgi:hypothetical protein